MKRHTCFHLLIISLLYSLSISATINIRSVQMTTEDGIANNTIRYLMQDSKGYIWMGTQDGLSRYDGNSFVTFRPETGDRISLADYRIKMLEEDKNGFLWITTSQELYSCFDLKKDCFVDFTGCGEYKQPYSFKMTASNGDVWLWHKKNGCRRIRYQDDAFTSTVFKREKGTLPFDSPNYVYEAEDGSIWIGSNEGVAHIEGDKAVLIDNCQNASSALSYNQEVFLLSSFGKITVKKNGKPTQIAAQLKMESNSFVYGNFRLQDDWVIMTSEGGFVFNLKNYTVTRPEQWNIKGGRVQTDNRGNIWLYNNTGKVWYVNIKTTVIKTFQVMPSHKVHYIDQERYYIVHDSRDIIWITTYGNGLFAYDLKSDELQHFTFEVNGKNHISSNSLLNIIEDRTGGIWVSSEYTGISQISVVSSGAQRIFLEDETLSDQTNAIRMITRMNNDDIWISSRYGSLYAFDAQMNRKQNTRNYAFNIYSMTEGPDGSLWLGSRGNGLYIDGKWYNTSNSSITENSIYSIHRDSKNRMWIGTLGGGLHLAKKIKDGYTFTPFLNETYSQSRIRVIQEDSNGYMWVGTSYGVYVFHPDSIIANPHDYSIYNYTNGQLCSNEIRSIIQDQKGNIWIATAGGGISVCNPKDNYKNLTFEHFNTSNGLVNNMVQSIVEDKEGMLWIATEFGISRFEPKTESFENFFFSTTALGNVYSENCACVSNDGKVLFGTNYGLIAITPNKIRSNAHSAPTVNFTDLLVNGISVRPGDPDSPLNRGMAYTDKVTLKHFQNAFIVKFSTFDYSDMGSTKYSYYLESYDKEWSLSSSLNFASYKNLAPGKYKLHVKACNNNGKWSDKESILEIVVAPPFWQTYWAFLSYIVLLLAALYFTLRLIKKINNLRNKIQVEKQLTEYKLVFFTNISHEFRTPLTLIQGGLEKIKTGGKIPKEMAYSIKIMDKSTQRMLRLINQLLEFRKMQNNKLALSLEETDVIAFLHEIFLSFKDIAESKNMDFKFLPSIDIYKMFIDKGNLDKVAYNLLSNAFKYTANGGKVTLSVIIDEIKKSLVISVIDTGVGIPKEKRSELFKRFMQSNFSGNSVGIGLHLTYELVNVHKGSITYEENPIGGSIFRVSLPTNTGSYKDNDFLIPHNILLQEEAQHKELHSTNIPEETDASLPVNPLNKRNILIIEDDNDIRQFLQNEIGQYFEVITESDGLSGLERARTYDADLIICDVLMPGLTGFEVTRQLKNDFNTSHIPIILLTAMSSADSHLEGVESGADAYITKPFNPKLLLARVFKLIEQRDKLRDKFSKDPGMLHPVICTTDRDKIFVDKLQDLLEKQLDNDQLNVDEMATMMGLGRTVFYRKVRGLTGYSPNEYIRIIRMKKAAELLLEDRLTVSEISYKVGINDPLYFSKCFKQQFGVAPTVYRRSVLNPS